MEVFSVVALAALVVKLTSLSKFVRAKHYGDAISQVFVLVVAVALAWIAANSSAMSDVDINGTTFGSLDGGSIVLVGLALGSTASFAYDYRKARDNTDSAAEPSLVPENNPT